MTNLAEELAKLSPEQLRDTVEQAKKLSLQTRIGAVPPDEIERFKLAHKRLGLGQKIFYSFNVPIKMEFTIRADYEYGNFSEIDINFLIEDIDSPGKAWLEYLKDMWESDASMYIGENCPTGIDDKVADACDEESEVWAKLRRMQNSFEEKYGIDPYQFIED